MARISTKLKERKNAFGDNYILIEHDGGYLLYDKTERGSHSQHQYLGKFYISNGTNCRYAFRDDYYDTVEELVSAIKEYNSTLPFDADTYNPIYRKHVKIEYALTEYLTRLGLKLSSFGHEGTTYQLSDPYGQTICSIGYEVKEDTTEGRIVRNIIGQSSRWQEIPFTDMDSAIAAVNSTLSVYCVIINAQIFETLEKLTNARATQMLDKEFDYNTFSIIVKDNKQKSIEILEQELKRLKEN